MALNNTLVKTTLLLDGKQPEQVLKGLSEKADKLERDITDALNAGDTKKLKELYKEYNAIQKQTNQIKSATFDVQKALNNLNGASMKDLRKVASALNHEIEGMVYGTKEFIAKSAELQKVKARMNEINTAVKGVDTSHKSFFARASEGFNKYFAVVTAAVGAFAGIVIGIRKAIEMSDQYEQSLANLSALTGLVGDDLKWLGEQAKQLSVGQTESGIKITKSATDILEAYKLMGSAKPELLKNKEALASVTENALILAEAASMETAPAVEALASIMNQFGAGADQSTKYINILAAGSKEGAAEVTDLSDAIIRSGAAATQANITIEQEVALIEALAEKGIKAERAGTGLRGMILKMQKGADEFNPKVVGLNQALENLSAKNLDAREMMALFGEESYTVAQTLINSKDRVKDLTDAVTGTNVAFEQANINTSTNGAKLEQAKNKAALYAIELGEKLTPIMTMSTNVMGKFLKILSASIDFYVRNAKAINIAVVTIGTYIAANKIATLIEQARNKEGWIGIGISKAKVLWDNAARLSTLAGAAAQALFTGNLVRAKAAMALLTKTMNVNPFVLLATAVVALGYAIYELSQKESLAAKQAKILLDVQTEVKKGMIDEKMELQKWLTIARDKTRSDEDRAKAITKLNELSPEFLGNLTKENIATKEGAKLIDEYVASLERKWKVQVLEEKIKEEMKKATDIQNSSIKENIKWYDELFSAVNNLGYGQEKTAGKDLLYRASKRRTEALKDEVEIIKTLTEQYKTALEKTTSEDLSGGTTGGGTEGLSGDGKSKTVSSSWTEEERKYYDEMLKENLAKLRAYLDKEKEAMEKQTEEVFKNYKQRKEADEQTGEQIEAQVQLRLEHEYALEQDKMAKLQELRDQNLISQSQYEDELLKLTIERVRKEFDGAIQVANSAASIQKAFNSKQNAEDDAKLTHLKNNNAQYLENLQKLYDRGAITKEEYDKRKAASEKKLDNEVKQIQNEQAKRDQEMAMFEQTIATAVAIAKAIELAFSKSSSAWEAIAAAGFAVAEVIVLMAEADKYQAEAPQFAGGNTPDMVSVRGAQTGKLYNARYQPRIASGIYPDTTFINGLGIVGEDKRPELIVSYPDLSRVSMNYPALTDAFISAATGFPQYAQGNLPQKTGSGSLQPTYLSDPEMKSILMAILEETRKPGKSYVVLQDVQKKEQLLSEIESSVTR